MTTEGEEAVAGADHKQNGEHNIQHPQPQRPRGWEPETRKHHEQAGKPKSGPTHHVSEILARSRRRS